jgi:hypothetical protein
MLPADLHALGQDLRRAALRRRRRQARRIGAWVAVAVVAACGGVAVGAASLLGSPAPGRVQSDLQSAVRYALADHPGLRPETARVVATSPAATLYSIARRDGSYCAELIGTAQGVIYGFTCARAQRAPNGQLLLADAYAPNVSFINGSDGTSPPVVQFGRLPAGTISARAVFDNGVTEAIQAGLDGFFVYQPSPANQALARRMPMTLEFRDRDGLVWSYYDQPPQPISVREDGRITGDVLIDRAAQVELSAAAKIGLPGTRVFVPIHADGTFTWRGRPGSVVYSMSVRNAKGEPVSADTPVLTSAAVRRLLAPRSK